jgi:hypothetical protein
VLVSRFALQNKGIEAKKASIPFVILCPCGLFLAQF